MRVYLTHCGYRVLFAQNGIEAIKKAASEIPDLVITDIMLEDMDGVRIALELRKDVRTRHIPILAVTAKTLSEANYEIMSNVFDDILKKPVDLRQFDAAIQKFLKEDVDRRKN